MVYLNMNRLKSIKKKDINDDNNSVSLYMARLRQNESPNNTRLRLNVFSPLAIATENMADNIF